MGSIEFLRPTQDERILAARLEDLAIQGEQRIKFTRFLDERGFSIAKAVATEVDCEVSFFGGYEGAQQKVICFHPSYIEISNEDFLIVPLCFRFKKEYKLSHRDFLGSLMSQNVKRDVIGDIIIGEGEATAFVLKQVSQPIISDITKVGRVGVSITQELPTLLPTNIQEEIFSGILSSMRLDGVIAMLSKESRESSQKLVSNGSVKQNSRVATKITDLVAKDDVISIRGFGKFKILTDGVKTKKDRLRLTFSKYI